MWLKLVCLLVYVLLLFAVARVMDSLAWGGLSGCSNYACQLLDPVLMSVVQLKAILDQRGLSYEGVVEKSELTALVDASGHVSIEEAGQSQVEEPTRSDTNFTSGPHFIEQVEDAKDSVWLVQVSGQPTMLGQAPDLLGESRWKSLKRKLARFGVRMGRFDCSLDYRYCRRKNWNTPLILLAMPSQHQKKADLAMYNFSSFITKETTLVRWVREKLDERVDHIADVETFNLHWRSRRDENSLDPEIRVVLFTSSNVTPMFYSALSVKFPGRVKFGLVHLDRDSYNIREWKDALNSSKLSKLPSYVIYTREKNYTFGFRAGEYYSFTSMERFLKTLYPCLNDIFIVSFCLANIISWLELFISNCSLRKRFRKWLWCFFKYNVMVIMLWLPIIAIFQMPFLDQAPLVALKCIRLVSMSSLGQMLRGYYAWYINHPYSLLIITIAYTIFIAKLCAKYRPWEPDYLPSDWFNFSQMRTLTHIRPNDFLDPMSGRGYDLLRGLDMFGSQLSQPSIWLPPPISPDYIQRLPTWKFNPVPLASRAQANVGAIHAVLSSSSESKKSLANTGTGNYVRPSCSIASSSNQVHPPHEGSCCAASNLGELNGAAVQQSKSVAHCQSLPQCTAHERISDLRGCSACELSRSNIAGTSSSVSNMHLSSASLGSPRSSAHLPDNNTLSENLLPSSSAASSTACSCWPNKRIGCLSNSDSDMLANPADQNNHPHSSSQTEIGRCTCAPETKCRICESLGNNLLASPGNTSSTSLVQSNASHQPPKQSVVPPAPRENGFPRGFLESLQCVICLEDYVPSIMLCGLPCGHVFHETCIISWLNLDKHFCPVCRWPSFQPRQPPQLT